MSTPLDPMSSYGAAPPGETEDSTPNLEQSPLQAATGASAAPIYPPYPPVPSAPYPYAYPAPPYPGAPAYAPASPPGVPYPVYFVPVAAAQAGPTPGKRRRPGYLIVAVGCAVALIGYFALPLLTFTLSANDSADSFNYHFSYAYTASQLTSLNGLSAGTLGFTLSSLFWLLPVVTIFGLIASVALPYTNLTASRSAHWLTAISLQLCAVAAGAVLLLGTLQLRDEIDQLTNLSGLSGTSFGFGESFDIAFGLYVTLGGLALVLIGGILVLARSDRAVPVPVAMAAPAGR